VRGGAAVGCSAGRRGGGRARVGGGRRSVVGRGIRGGRCRPSVPCGRSRSAPVSVCG
jgi:hypothetical protein